VTESATQSSKKLLWEKLSRLPELKLVKLKSSARFRLFAHTKRDIGGNRFDEGGSSFALCENCSLGSHKESATRATLKEISAWNRTDDPWVYFKTHGKVFTGWLGD